MKRPILPSWSIQKLLLSPSLYKQRVTCSESLADGVPLFNSPSGSNIIHCLARNNKLTMLLILVPTQMFLYCGNVFSYSPIKTTRLLWSGRAYVSLGSFWFLDVPLKFEDLNKESSMWSFCESFDSPVGIKP